MPYKTLESSSPFSLFFRSWPEMLRLKSLDRLLSDGELHSLENLVLDCSIALEGQGEKAVSSKNTILNDMETLKKNWNAEIVSVKSGRNIGYKYANEGFSVFSVDYDEKKIRELQHLMQFLAPLRGIEGFEWSVDLLSKMEKAYGLQSFSDKFISFETHIDVVGADWVQPIYNNIVREHSIKIVYKSFWWKEPKQITVSPYYLKQYNQRWYLLAKNEATNKLALYGLDRILDLEAVDSPFSPCDCIPFDYFNDIVGVTNLKDCPVETIRLEVDKSYFDYIDNRPIHPSQCVESEDDDKVTVTLKVKVNVELEKLLLAEALNIRVVEPQWLKMRITDKLKKAFDSYK